MWWTFSSTLFFVELNYFCSFDSTIFFLALDFWIPLFSLLFFFSFMFFKTYMALPNGHQVIWCFSLTHGYKHYLYAAVLNSIYSAKTPFVCYCACRTSVTGYLTNIWSSKFKCLLERNGTCQIVLLLQQTSSFPLWPVCVQDRVHLAKTEYGKRLELLPSPPFIHSFNHQI